jgi:hypothetical protein
MTLLVPVAPIWCAKMARQARCPSTGAYTFGFPDPFEVALVLLPPVLPASPGLD